MSPDYTWPMCDFVLGSFIFIHLLVKHCVCIKAVINAILFGKEMPCYSQNETFSLACLQRQSTYTARTFSYCGILLLLMPAILQTLEQRFTPKYKPAYLAEIKTVWAIFFFVLLKKHRLKSKAPMKKPVAACHGGGARSPSCMPAANNSSPQSPFCLQGRRNLEGRERTSARPK